MNQLGFPILTLLIAIPTLAAVACLFADAKAARWIALGATLADFVLGIVLWATFQTGGVPYLTRLTLCLNEGIIERVYYPIDLPAAHAREVCAYLGMIHRTL